MQKQVFAHSSLAHFYYILVTGGGMVDTGDLKSLEGNLVRVQVPPRALTANQGAPYD